MAETLVGFPGSAQRQFAPWQSGDKGSTSMSSAERTLGTANQLPPILGRVLAAVDQALRTASWSLARLAAAIGVNNGTGAEGGQVWLSLSLAILFAIGEVLSCGLCGFANLRKLLAQSSQRARLSSSSGEAAIRGPEYPVLRPGEQRLLSWEEIRRHDKPGDAWLAIQGQVYDVSSWAPSHPGGSIIFKFVGADATDQFSAFHREVQVKHRLRAMHIGSVEAGTGEPKPLPVTLAYRDLHRRLWEEGYFEADAGFYMRKHLVWLSLLLVGAAVTMGLVTEVAWVRVLVGGVLVGLGWHQAAFMAHDSAHYGVEKPTPGGGINWLAWFMAAPVFGISGAMWNEEHSIHHAITIRAREDPQFDYLPIWLIDEKEVQPGPAGAGSRAWTVDCLTRLLVRVQHWTFLPLCMVVGRFNFYLLAFAFALKRLPKLDAALDIVGMALYWAWVVPMVLTLPNVWWQAAFLVLSHTVVGMLHVQLLLSHLAMGALTQEEEREAQFFKFQLLTSRNISCAWWEHWFHGGLEFQIEHHLFPQLPRHNLHKVAPMVRAICEKHGIEYVEQDTYSAMCTVLGDLRRLSTALISADLN